MCIPVAVAAAVSAIAAAGSTVVGIASARRQKKEMKRQSALAEQQQREALRERRQEFNRAISGPPNPTAFISDAVQRFRSGFGSTVLAGTNAGAMLGRARLLGG